VSDELLRPFLHKIRRRPQPARAAADPPDGAVDEIPPDSILIRDVQAGPFPEAARLHSGFVPGVPRIRITLDMGAGFRGGAAPFGRAEIEALREFCPHLADHDCGGGDAIPALLAGKGATDASAGSPVENGLEGDGLFLAHLIEHVAIEIIVAVSGGRRCSGATCAYTGRLDRFDIFLECVDPFAGRAAAVLAAALVRDLRLRRMARLPLHRRCRDLLAILIFSSGPQMVAEDTAARLGCGTDEALQTLEELVRLGYLEVVPSAYLFSSTSGVLFRKAVTRAHSG